MIIAMPRDLSDYPGRVYMAEICRELVKDRSTVITWDTKKWLPEHLLFERDENGWRYWSRDQLEQARAWINRPGRRRAPQRTNAA
jgi:hypothetical protein